VETRWRLTSGEPVVVRLDSAMRVVRVLVDGRPNTRISRTMYARSGTDVLVPHQKTAGDTMSTRIRYHGITSRGGRLGPNAAGERAVLLESWPDRAWLWLPVQEPAGRAAVTLHVQAPVNQRVVTGGRLEKVDTLPYDRAIWHYRMEAPVPLNALAVVTGHFAVARLPDAGCAVRCVPLAVWSWPDDSGYATTAFRRAGDMADYFTRVVGPYPYPGLSHVEAPTETGGMETAGAAFYDESRFRERRLDETYLARATARQWFGQAVSEAGAEDRWVTAGLAVYFAALWRGEADGDPAFAAAMRQAAEAVLGTETPPPGPRGAWIAHQLRLVVGDSAFFAGVRRLYQERRDSTVSAGQLAQLMSQTSGRDLDWYFQQAGRPGYPALDLRWTHRGKKLTLEITQTQPAEWGEYRLPGLVVLVDGRPVRLDVTGRRTLQMVDGITRRPTTVEVAPASWLVRTSGGG